MKYLKTKFSTVGNYGYCHYSPASKMAWQGLDKPFDDIVTDGERSVGDTVFHGVLNMVKEAARTARTEMCNKPKACCKEIMINVNIPRGLITSMASGLMLVLDRAMTGVHVWSSISAMPRKYKYDCESTQLIPIYLW